MEVSIERLKKHVLEIASIPRPAESAELEEARLYVEKELLDSGWEFERVPFKATADTGISLTGYNQVARHPRFSNGDLPRFIVGAHLDSKPDSPGADDNGSAVAALLEIARLLPENWPENSLLDLELIFFDLEENGMLGGAFCAAQCKQEKVDLRGMISLEMLGYCDHSPNSQSLPKALIGLYPETGNFIALVGNQNSDDLINQFATGMKKVDQLPVELLSVPENGNMLQATRLSDHSPFWDEGFAALMITDTSFMRNPHYHKASDTPETLDYDFLHKVTQGSVEAVRHILQTGLK